MANIMNRERKMNKMNDDTISRQAAVNIVHNIIAAHIRGKWNEEAQAQVLSAWDWELCEINKEICKRIRDEVEE